MALAPDHLEVIHAKERPTCYCASLCCWQLRPCFLHGDYDILNPSFRRQFILSHYKRLHGWLWQEWKDISQRVLLPAVSEEEKNRWAVDNKVVCCSPFTAEFLSALKEETANFLDQAGNLPHLPPSIHVSNGVVLSELGMNAVFSGLIRDWLSPLAMRLFPEALHSGLSETDFFTSIVKFDRDDEEHELGTCLHTDESSLTLAVCLGDEFEGGAFLFPGCAENNVTGDNPQVVRQGKGQAIVFLGSQPHATEPLGAGTRYGLVLWCASRALSLASSGDIYEKYTRYLSNLVSPPKNNNNNNNNNDSNHDSSSCGGGNSIGSVGTSGRKRAVQFDVPLHFFNPLNAPARRPPPDCKPTR